MVFPERFSNLPEYAFPRLRTLLNGHAPGGDELQLTIGEPRHAFPDFLGEEIAAHLQGFGNYPVNPGNDALLGAISDWIGRRFNTDVQTNRIMALNGTREGLMGAAIGLCPEQKNGKTPAVLIPNPFYQCYMVGTLAGQADPIYLSATEETGFLPDFDAVDAETLERTAIVFLCSPSNPQGAVASRDYWANLLKLAEKHDFRVFSDECYSEIWRIEKPVSALQVAEEIGVDPERVCIFHSLSKRSNLPGLRSGFVAGGVRTITHLRQLREYSGAPLPAPLQFAAAKVWADEAHVEASRQRYLTKHSIADSVFAGVDGCGAPEAGFFLWLPVEDGEMAAVKLWEETGVKVLPGAYLAQDVNGVNPGTGYIRIAMVAEEEEMQRGCEMIRDCLYK